MQEQKSHSISAAGAARGGGGGEAIKKYIISHRIRPHAAPPRAAPWREHHTTKPRRKSIENTATGPGCHARRGRPPAGDKNSDAVRVQPAIEYLPEKKMGLGRAEGLAFVLGGGPTNSKNVSSQNQ